MRTFGGMKYVALFKEYVVMDNTLDGLMGKKNSIRRGDVNGFIRIEDLSMEEQLNLLSVIMEANECQNVKWKF